MLRGLLTISIAAQLLVALAAANTYVVNPDGSGDFPTIQAAIDAAVDGDIIELADGTFQGDGNRDISYRGKALTVMSEGGDPEECIIDCGGRRGFRFETGEGSNAILMGVKVTGGMAHESGVDDGCGGAVRCEHASPRIRHCIFYNNMCSEAGAAVFCQGGSLEVSDCRFDENRTAISAGMINGGGMACYAATPSVTNSAFYFNIAVYGGGLSLLHGSEATVTGCTFTFNIAPEMGAGIYCDRSSINLVGSTMFYSGICLAAGAEATIANTIVASTLEDAGVQCGDAGSTASLTCCDLFGNEGGDWVGCIADQYGIGGNVCADPLFCDPENDDFNLDCMSPCAAGNNPECGQIGAWPVGCGPTPAVQTTWGALKELFGR